MSVKDETPSSLEPTSEASLPARMTELSPVTEEEVRTVLRAIAPVSSQDLVSRFRSRVLTQEVGCFGFLMMCFVFNVFQCILSFIAVICDHNPSISFSDLLPLHVQDLMPFILSFCRTRKHFLTLWRRSLTCIRTTAVATSFFGRNTSEQTTYPTCIWP